jgi:hypothetical protein
MNLIYTLPDFRAAILTLLCLVFITGLLGANVSAQLSSVDPTFNPSITKDVVSGVTGNVAVQPDGKIIIFGLIVNA